MCAEAKWRAASGSHGTIEEVPAMQLEGQTALLAAAAAARAMRPVHHAPPDSRAVPPQSELATHKQRDQEGFENDGLHSREGGPATLQQWPVH